MCSLCHLMRNTAANAANKHSEATRAGNDNASGYSLSTVIKACWAHYERRWPALLDSQTQKLPQLPWRQRLTLRFFAEFPASLVGCWKVCRKVAWGLKAAATTPGRSKRCTCICAALPYCSDQIMRHVCRLHVTFSDT